MVKANEVELKNAISGDSINPYINGINGTKKSAQKNSRHAILRKNAENKSFDTGILRIPDSPTISAKTEIYSYGRRDSLNRTRFLLVRTSSGQGKESFKRVTLPGGSTVESLKFTIEKAMKTGRVAKVCVLPSKTPIEQNEQICELKDSQKVEVTFEAYDWVEGPRNSPTEKTFCEKKLNGKVARWNSNFAQETNETAEKTITSHGQWESLAENFKIPNGLGVLEPNESTVTCSFVLPSSLHRADITLEHAANSRASFQLISSYQPKETEQPQTEMSPELSPQERGAPDGPNYIVQSTSEVDKNAKYQLTNGKDTYVLNKKAAALLGFLRTKVTEGEAVDMPNELKMAQVILIVASIGGVVGIGYYFYSRYK